MAVDFCKAAYIAFKNVYKDILMLPYFFHFMQRLIIHLTQYKESKLSKLKIMQKNFNKYENFMASNYYRGFVEICGDVWRCVEICGDLWKCVEICGDVWRYMEICGDVFKCE